MAQQEPSPSISGGKIAERELERLIPPKEAAGYLGIETNTLSHWRLKGKGPAFFCFGGVDSDGRRRGRGTIRYRLGDVLAWRDQYLRGHRP